MFARAARQSLRRVRSPKPAQPPLRRTFFWSSSAPPLAPVAELASSSIPSTASDLLLPLLAALLLSSDSEDPSPVPPWTPTDLSSSGKGIGCLAKRDLRRGELLIAERPLCVWPRDLSEELAKELFEAMGLKEQAVFMALAKSDGLRLDEVRARRSTNGFAIALPGSGKVVGMVFPQIARINHSCLPNASQVMNFETLRMEVYPLTPIPALTELSIEYLPSLITQTRAARQLALKASFGFPQCLCPACSATPEEVAKSDARRTEIKHLGDCVRSGRGDRAGTLARLERIRLLLGEEGYVGLPEFEDPAVTNAYAVYATMHARSMKEKVG